MKGKTWAIWIFFIVLIIASFIFLKGAEPPLPLASETLFHVGPWDVRNTVIDSWTVIVVLALVAYLATRKIDLVPVRGMQNFVEAMIEWMFGIVEEVAGEQNARRFFPLVGTIFLYIVVSNWFAIFPLYYSIGLARTPDIKPGETAHAAVYHKFDLGPIPIAYTPIHPKSVEVSADSSGHLVLPAGQTLATSNHSEYVGVLAPFFRSVFSDANAPLSIALISFFMVEYWGLSTLGAGYLKKFVNVSAVFHGKPMGVLDIYVGLLETISELVRIISFTFRLLGNTFASDTLFIFMTFLIPFVVPMAFYGLDLFDGFIQAAVFSLLTLVFAVMAVSHHEEGGEHEATELEPA